MRSILQTVEEGFMLVCGAEAAAEVKVGVKRVAAFLLEESSIEGTNTLKITHENIANHLGSHREVITRMLRYFQNEGIVKLSRGVVEITDTEKLEELSDQ